MTRERGSRLARVGGGWTGGGGGWGTGPPGKVGPVVHVISRLILGFDFSIGGLLGKLFRARGLKSANAAKDAVKFQVRKGLAKGNILTVVVEGARCWDGGDFSGMETGLGGDGQDGTRARLGFGFARSPSGGSARFAGH